MSGMFCVLIRCKRRRVIDNIEGGFFGSSLFGRDPFDDPFFNTPMFGGGGGGSMFSSSMMSGFGGGRGGESRSVSTSTRIVNGVAQTTTVTKIQNDQVSSQK